MTCRRPHRSGFQIAVAISLCFAPPAFALLPVFGGLTTGSATGNFFAANGTGVHVDTRVTDIGVAVGLTYRTTSPSAWMGERWSPSGSTPLLSQPVFGNAFRATDVFDIEAVS